MFLQRIFAILFILGMVSFPALAEEPTGPVLVTVTGEISITNRGPLDEFADAYVASQADPFEKAFSFDLQTLEALGMKSLEVSYPDWPKAYTFEGPLLSDVMDVVGATGSTLLVRALDGYTPEISVEEIRKYPVILALKQDGQYLSVGGRGPAWVIYPRNDFEELAEQDDSKFVWAVYHIEVK